MKRIFLSFYSFFICSVLLVQFGIAPIVSNVLSRYFENEFLQHSRGLVKGVLHLMEEDLLGQPKESWTDRIKQLQMDFGYEIGLESLATLSLPAVEVESLRRGEIVVVDDGEYFYYKVKGSNMVISQGPFSIVPQLGIFQYVFWLGVFALVAMPTAIWVIPFWRKLQKISNTAIDFGNGEFSARAEIPPRSALAPIATAFNTMAERVQQLISSHKELTNAVSHELRTPISRIRFGLELLDDPDETAEKKKQYINGLYGDVEELEELVTELLTFAKFDREKPELHLEKQSIVFLLQLVLKDIAGEGGMMECQLNDRLREGDKHLIFDYKYLARAVGNLVQNAMHYGDKQLLVTVERSSKRCLIHIEDDGPGIMPSDREKIFEPFTRLDSSRSRDSGGYGLGLAIVSRIVKWHGGDITVTNGRLGGASFILSLPWES